MKKIKLKKRALLIILFSFLLLFIVLFASLAIYFTSKVSSDKTVKNIVIEEGSTISDIASLLKENNLIKSEKVFRLFVKLKKADNIYAATYHLSPSMDLEEIIDALVKGGYNENEIEITFLEGLSIKDYAKTIAKFTNNSEEDVLNLLKDKKYLNGLIDKYWFITEDILNKDIYYSLEGYLLPDTYRFMSKDVTVKEIFEVMLDEMNKVLTPYKNDIKKSNYSIHQILTMASMAELEGLDKSSRKGITSVFYNRLNSGMSLGSDVTTYYAFQVSMSERDLNQSEFDTYNPYNTRGPKMIGKLPVGPIANVSRESIEAAVKPEKSDNYYFVADKNGKVYFTKTNSEHEEIIARLQNEGLWYEW